MRRHPALAELSRDHHQALAVALGLRRATADTASAARAAFLAFWRDDGAAHFDAEEAVLLPVLGDHPLCRRVRCEHQGLRGRAAALEADPEARVALLQQTGSELAAHVRLEERELFPVLERTLDDDALARLGRDLAAADPP